MISSNHIVNAILSLLLCGSYLLQLTSALHLNARVTRNSIIKIAAAAASGHSSSQTRVRLLSDVKGIDFCRS